MSDKTKRLFSGRTLGQAVLAAAADLGVPPDELAYREMARKTGRLRAVSRVVIEVDPEAPRKPAEAPRRPPESSRRPAEAPARPSPALHRESQPVARAPRPRPSPDAAPPVVVRDDVELLADLGGLVVAAEVSEHDDGLTVELEGEDRGRLTDHRGELLQAIEHLAQRMAARVADGDLRLRVDSGGFRAQREEELQQLAQGVCEEALAAGEERTLPPMTPAERRIVHLALRDLPGVETESRGDGYLKRVHVLPVRDQPAGNEE